MDSFTSSISLGVLVALSAYAGNHHSVLVVHELDLSWGASGALSGSSAVSEGAQSA